MIDVEYHRDMHGSYYKKHTTSLQYIIIVLLILKKTRAIGIQHNV